MLILLLVIAMIYGIVAFVAPEGIWHLQERMRYKDEREPSTAGLVMIRLQGVAIVLIVVMVVIMKMRGEF